MQQRIGSLYLNNPSVLLFGVGWKGTSNDWFSSFKTQFSPLVNALPFNVHLLTLRALPTSNNDVLLRLNHIFAVGMCSLSLSLILSLSFSLSLILSHSLSLILSLILSLFSLILSLFFSLSLSIC